MHPVVGLAIEHEAGLEAALRAELQAMGFATATVPQSLLPGDASTIDGVARAMGAVAVVKVVGGADLIEIWIADTTTKKILLRHVVRAAHNPQQALVLQVVELLRASFLEAALPPRPSASHTQSAMTLLPARVQRALQMPTQSRWRAGVGAAAMMAAANADVSVVALATAAYQVNPRWGADLLGFATVRAATLKGEGDSTSISTFLLGGGARFALWPQGSARLNAAVAGGLCGVHAAFQGEAAVPLREVKRSVTDAGGYGRIIMELPLSSAVHLAVQAAGVVTARAVKVDFAAQEVGSWGRPLLLLGALLEVTLP